MIVHKRITAVCLLTGMGCMLATLFFSCGSHAKKYQRNKSHAQTTDETLAAGEQLAAKYCQSCHLLPDPTLLDAASWENGVLPQMGPRLGIFEHMMKKYPNNSGDPDIGKDFYPKQPLLTASEWQTIIDYYTTLSPDTLPRQHRETPITISSAIFTATAPAYHYPQPASCFVKLDTASGQVFTADIFKQALLRFNSNLQVTDSLHTGGAVVDVVQHGDSLTACNIGGFAPTNAKEGFAQRIVSGKTVQLDKTPVFKDLVRPVSMASGDFTGNGKEDYVVCEFGYLTGELSWMENKGGGNFEKHVLRNVPGAIKTYVQDYNHDGKPDIWVLFAQGDEGIFLYTNKGNGQFTQENILRFPPCYGSTFFELTDFNKDGYPDIVYTCGDNGDYSLVLKPYHGVYIYLNDGHNHFTQHYFFPQNGAYKALVRDFDNDGDLDIASIAYFADFAHQPEESFVYLQNQGNGSFKPYSLPETQQGRWIAMDAADIDHDGKTELVLANCSVGPTFIQAPNNWKQGPPFLFLKLK